MKNKFYLLYNSCLSALRANFIALVIVFAWIFASQGTFYLLQKNQTRTTVQSLDSLFHALLGPSNFQMLSSIITDLEINGTIKCPVVKNLRGLEHYTILDLSYRGDCVREAWLINGERAEMTTLSANGDQYEIAFSTVNSIASVIALWGFRIFGLLVILGLSYFRNFKHRQEQKISETKIQGSKVIEELAYQVSHDIRSPLAALNMIIGTLKNIPEDQRITLRSVASRINDIANQLLQQGHSIGNHDKQKPVSPNIEKSAIELTVELLPTLVDLIASEKRVQYREKSNVTIETDSDSGYGAFAKINSIEFKRVLSNLINNSVEALKKEGGQIIIAVSSTKSKTLVSIKDDGRGVPPKILAKLGELGVTHGKEGTEKDVTRVGTEGGSGIGVYHAKRIIESFGAKFEITSQEHQGTEVKMEFPNCEIPSWFVASLQIGAGQTIVALDDDQSVLDIWRQRVRELQNNSITLVTLTSANDLFAWVNKNSEVAASTLFLMDYELLGQEYNGLDLIEKLGLHKRAVLVTSRFEEPQIRNRCEHLGVKQIPKSMAPIVPFELIADQPKIDFVLIDDDSLVALSWQFMANLKKKTILCFTDENAFLLAKKNVGFATPIYVDVSLSNGVRGQDVASRLFGLGFCNISLATGYPSDSIATPHFIKEVIGKEPPF